MRTTKRARPQFRISGRSSTFSNVVRSGSRTQSSRAGSQKVLIGLKVDSLPVVVRFVNFCFQASSTIMFQLFATCTRRLAYDVSEGIQEFNPSRHYHLKLADNLIGMCSLHISWYILSRYMLHNTYNKSPRSLIEGYRYVVASCTQKSVGE